jgi:hypothetical protein
LRSQFERQAKRHPTRANVSGQPLAAPRSAHGQERCGHGTLHVVDTAGCERCRDVRVHVVVVCRRLAGCCRYSGDQRVGGATHHHNACRPSRTPTALASLPPRPPGGVLPLDTSRGKQRKSTLRRLAERTPVQPPPPEAGFHGPVRGGVDGATPRVGISRL